MTETTQSKGASGRRKWSGGYDPPRTRRALIDSALKLFDRDGFDRTSLQQIVDGAGLTKGAFYHHFNSKEDVLWEIQNEYLDAQMAAAESIFARYPDDCAAQLRELIRLSLSGVAEYRAHVSIFYQERRHLTGERLQVITEKRDSRVQLFRETIRRGVEDGTFKPGTNARIASFGILGMVALAVQWYDPHGSLTIDDVADQFCDLALDGLLP